jgi:hypothetical protein
MNIVIVRFFIKNYFSNSSVIIGIPIRINTKIDKMTDISYPVGKQTMI